MEDSNRNCGPGERDNELQIAGGSPVSLPSRASTQYQHLCQPAQRMVFQAYLIFSLSFISLLNSFGLGITTIALPQIVTDLQIPRGLALWPGTVNTFALACCLLPAGAIADIVGSRRVSLTGTVLLAAFTIACGVAPSSVSLILFRALAGMGAALVQPTSVSLVSHIIPKGRLQNIGFSCLGLSILFGFATGLILGGVFASIQVGWRLGFYICGGFLCLLTLCNSIALPRDRIILSASLLKRVRVEIDWMGAGLVAAAFAVLSYSFSLMTEGISNVRRAPALSTLCIGASLLSAFALWTRWQHMRGRVVLLPSHIWINWEFIILCSIVFCAWAVLNTMEWVFSIYFQVIQELSALESAIRFLPNLVLGVIIEIFIGAYMHRLQLVPTIAVSVLISAASPLLMALIDPSWSNWRGTLWAMLFLPVAVDVLFTAAALLITDIFPQNMHSVAGATFSVVRQLGTAGGIAIMALIASGVSQKQSTPPLPSTQQASADGIMYSLSGLVAVFWACFALSIIVVVLAPIGLRKRKYIGQKEDSQSD